MTPELRAGLRALAEALGADTAVPVPPAVLLELLDGTAAQPAPSAGTLPPVDLTAAEVGQRLGRAASTIRGYCERGELPGAYRWRSREWRIPPAALIALEQAERDGSAGTKTGAARPRGRPVDLSAWRRSAS